MTDIAHRLSISSSTVICKLNKFKFEASWDEYSFKSFIAQNVDTNEVLAILDGRTQTIIRTTSCAVRMRVKVMTMDMFSPYCQLAPTLFPNTQVVLDCFHLVRHLSRSMNQFDRKSQEYQALKRHWKMIQQDSNKFIKRKAFGFQNFENFQKRILIVLNIRKESTVNRHLPNDCPCSLCY